MGYRTRLRRQSHPIEFTPSAKSLIDEFGLNPRKIKGTGQGGKIIKRDVTKYLSTQDAISSGEEE
ncbi:MAG: E3 binding domain-containing protein [Bacteroidota bacterium]